MATKPNRRDFMATTAVAGLAAAAAPLAASGPTMMRQGGIRPLVVTSENGFRFKNGGAKTCVETAFEKIAAGGDVLDAVIAGVNIVELDPLEDSVGYGGLPNADGIVQLDSCCMHGPKKSAGGVAASENVKTPSLAARAVMVHTDHHLLAGQDVTAFARNVGLEIVADLNTPNSRAKYLQWKKTVEALHYIKDPVEHDAAVRQVSIDMVKAGLINANHLYGTISCNAMNAKGEICGVTTTSGMAFKVPGRVGDSPILGAGLYLDNEVGAAGSTGRGEANLYNLCSFLIVEEMRRGAHPKDAGMTALKRIQANTVARLQNKRGLPNFGIIFYIFNKQGEHAGVTMYGPGKYAVCDDKGPRLENLDALLPGRAED